MVFTPGQILTAADLNDATPVMKNQTTTTDAAGIGTFTFGKTFPSPPVVVGTGGNAEDVSIVNASITTVGFQALFTSGAGTPLANGPVRLLWIAGPATP